MWHGVLYQRAQKFWDKIYLFDSKELVIKILKKETPE